MTVILHGIKNCDTVKKARNWLDENNIEYRFHDFRGDGIDEKMINKWLKQLDWRVLLNTRGTTWRKLSDKQRNGLNKTKAVELMLEHPAIIKRPVLAFGSKCHVGFKVDEYEALLKQGTG